MTRNCCSTARCRRRWKRSSPAVATREHGLIIAGSTGDLGRAYSGFIKEALKSRCGVYAAVESPNDGDLFGVRLPRNAAGGGPLGRGLLIRPGSMTPIQLAVGRLAGQLAAEGARTPGRPEHAERGALAMEDAAFWFVARAGGQGPRAAPRAGYAPATSCTPCTRSVEALVYCVCRSV